MTAAEPLAAAGPAQVICPGAPILPPPHDVLPVGHRFVKVHGVWTCANCEATA
jgi:hypothetical protein